MRTAPDNVVADQLPLDIQLSDDATFSTFHWGQNALLKQELYATLKEQGERFIYLWGPAGSGKSHLLQASCHAFHDAMYCPLTILQEFDPSIIDGMDEQCWISVDDVDAVANNPAWEEALFHLYNRVRAREDVTLLLSGNAPPTQLPIALPDLRSRLAWGLVLQLHELPDDEKLAVLIECASVRGFELPVPVARFLLNRCTRNLHDLHHLLDRLDKASLATQRKITIPFVKQVLAL